MREDERRGRHSFLITYQMRQGTCNQAQAVHSLLLSWLSNPSWAPGLSAALLAQVRPVISYVRLLMLTPIRIVIIRQSTSNHYFSPLALMLRQRP